MSEASAGWGVGLQNRKVSCRAGLCATLACSVFAGFLPQGARAQNEGDSADIDDRFPLGTPVSEARNTEELLEDIPFAVTRLTNSDADERHIKDAHDLLPHTTSAIFADFGFGVGNISSLRGVGSFVPVSGNETSPPLRIDGAVAALAAALYG